MTYLLKSSPSLALSIAQAMFTVLGGTVLLLGLVHGATWTPGPVLRGIILLLTLAPIAALIWAFRPVQPRPAHCSMFIRATPEVVWDRFQSLDAQQDYRPGARRIAWEQIADTPNTCRYTTQFDFLPGLTTTVRRVTIDDRPWHFQAEVDIDNDGTTWSGLEEGWLDLAPGGTNFRLRISRDRAMPWLAVQLASRRFNRDMRALAAVCEGQPVAPPRATLPESRFTQYGICIAIVAFVAQHWVPGLAWITLAVVFACAAFSALRLCRLALRIA